ALAPLPDWRPALPAPPPDAGAEAGRRAAVLHRLAAPLAPVLRVALAPARPRAVDRVPGDRVLPPGPVALHVETFLGGRRARCAAVDGLARPAARRHRRRRQRDAGTFA